MPASREDITFGCSDAAEPGVDGFDILGQMRTERMECKLRACVEAVLESRRSGLKLV